MSFSKVRPPGRFAVCVKFAIFFGLFWLCIFVFVSNQESDLLRELRDEDENLSIGKIHEKISDMVGKRFRVDHRDDQDEQEQIDRFQKVAINEKEIAAKEATTQATVTTTSIEADDGITPEARKFMSVSLVILLMT